MPKKKTAATKQKKLPRIKPINNFALLMVLSVFQLLSGTAAAGGTGTFEVKVLLCTLALIVLEWLYVSVFYFAMHRRNFELEFIAFFLSGVGITVIGSIKPDDAFKQLLMLIAGVIGFIVLVFLMGDVLGKESYERMLIILLVNPFQSLVVDDAGRILLALEIVLAEHRVLDILLHDFSYHSRISL